MPKRTSILASAPGWKAQHRPAAVGLDGMLVNWFKEHATDGDWRDEINRVLRRHVLQARKRDAR